MKSREVSGRDTRTGGLCADEVLDTETRQSSAPGQESTLPQPAPYRKAKRSQQCYCHLMGTDHLKFIASFCGVPRRLWWMIDAMLVVVDRMVTCGSGSK
ncbi:hypothetical protein KUCAC02_021205 [Chaenocephalus aceratus]|uniref:Uncharacterized protein n=1 Tax=Chaenocephalus aceratus TaxID=36190 RepID=A0ACB9XEV6_CHAAC|nr:hypothetical protein KUCAC02_021205 [Chaenocephalus aceratus]